MGSRVAKTCVTLGMNVLLNDPPRQRTERGSEFVSLETIQEQADIISFHVPLNMEGIDRTYHMADENFLLGLKKHGLIINTCRGEVFDSQAVYNAKRSGAISGMIIDCWENEPGLDLGLLKLADYGTPHIAGYSRDGKANGTTVSVRAISRFFGLGIDEWQPPGIEPPGNPVIELDGTNKDPEEILAEAILSSYKIEDDDKALRNSPQLFEQLRGGYPVRREFGSYSIKGRNIGPDVLEKLLKLGFKELKA